MWVSTSFSSALNFLPHQVRSAFQLSIRPPSSRMKRKFPCSVHAGTSSGLDRYNLGAGSKGWAGQRTRKAVTNPTSPMFLTIRTRCRVRSLRTDQDHHDGQVIGPRQAMWITLSDKVISRLNTLLVLMLCEFAQNKFLGQTADDMETHVNPKIFEYMPGSATRTGVVSGGDGISN